MTLKKKLKYNSLFKKGDIVISEIFGFNEILKITEIRVNKFKQIMYYSHGYWINEHLVRKATEEEISKYIADKLK